jgi:hypothetical protein
MIVSLEHAGRAPVWLYLRIAHVLHGKVKTLLYDSPIYRRSGDFRP